jgi:hypothetical protein
MSFKLLPAEGTVVRRAKAQALLATANAIGIFRVLLLSRTSDQLNSFYPAGGLSIYSARQVRYRMS